MRNIPLTPATPVCTIRHMSNTHPTTARTPASWCPLCYGFTNTGNGKCASCNEPKGEVR